jgi:hypothetical protein
MAGSIDPAYVDKMAREQWNAIERAPVLAQSDFVGRSRGQILVCHVRQRRSRRGLKLIDCHEAVQLFGGH